jgi:hypothetical protein
MLSEPFFETLYDQLGWDSEDWARPAMNWVSNNTAILTFLMGLGVGVWVHFFASRLSRILGYVSSDARTASLSLQYRRDPTPHETQKVNVFRWYSLKNVAMKADGTAETFSSEIFVTFDKPVDGSYSRVICSNPSIRIGVQDLCAKSALIHASGDLVDTTIDFIVSDTPI